MNLMEIAQGVMLMALGGIGTGVWQMVVTLKCINEHLVKLNGRMEKTEQWQVMHEEMDAKQFNSMRELLDAKTEK